MRWVDRGKSLGAEGLAGGAMAWFVLRWADQGRSLEAGGLAGDAAG